MKYTNPEFQRHSKRIMFWRTLDWYFRGRQQNFAQTIGLYQHRPSCHAAGKFLRSSVSRRDRCSPYPISPQVRKWVMSKPDFRGTGTSKKARTCSWYAIRASAVYATTAVSPEFLPIWWKGTAVWGRQSHDVVTSPGQAPGRVSQPSA